MDDQSYEEYGEERDLRDEAHTFLMLLTQSVYQKHPIEEIDALLERYRAEFEGAPKPSWSISIMNRFLGGFSESIKSKVGKFEQAWNKDKDADISVRLAEAFRTLDPEDWIWIARYNLKKYWNSSQDFAPKTIWQALVDAGYHPQMERDMDPATFKKVSRDSYDSSAPYAIGYIYEKLSELPDDFRSIFWPDFTMVKSARFGTAKFSRAQIIEALLKTGVNPKLAAARLLQG